jgi:hypothetical protein
MTKPLTHKQKLKTKPGGPWKSGHPWWTDCPVCPALAEQDCIPWEGQSFRKYGSIPNVAESAFHDARWALSLALAAKHNHEVDRRGE